MAEIKAKYKKYDKSKAAVVKASVERGGLKGKPAEKIQAEKEAKRKSAAQKSGAAVAKAKDTTEPKKYGEGNKTVIRDNKANVSEAQLKASGMSLRAYMNTWKKTGKRPGKKA